MTPEERMDGKVQAKTDRAVDYEKLAEYLGALAYPLRLELLEALKLPHTLSEIRVSPHRVEPGGNPERPAAKQTVTGHLEKLVESGLVQVRETVHGKRVLRTYVVAPQRMYAVTEELRRLLVQYAGRGLGEDATGTVAPFSAGPEYRGPRLVLVHGVYEGKTFPLDGTTMQDGAWTIGRRRGLSVALDYDPYVSVENSLVRRDGADYVVVALPESKNGTNVNWRPMPTGGSHRLRSGDLIGVGRSRLLFLNQ